MILKLNSTVFGASLRDNRRGERRGVKGERKIEEKGREFLKGRTGLRQITSVRLRSFHLHNKQTVATDWYLLRQLAIIYKPPAQISTDCITTIHTLTQ